MYGYQSKELLKLKTNVNDLDVSQMQNKEIVGLFLIGELSYKQMLEVLGLSDKEGRDLLHGLGDELGRSICRDDEDYQVAVWEATEDELKGK